MKRLFILFFFLFNTYPFFGQQLVERIESVLNSLPQGTMYGILIINPLSTDTIYARNISQSLIPASNTKLFTSAVALKLLGINYEVSTKLFTDSDTIRNGIINGNLYLKGYGNPAFSEKDIDNIVEKLKKLNVYKITGKIVGDDSFFDTNYKREDSIEDEKSSVKLPPISAIIYNRNQIVKQRKYKRRIRNYSTFIANPPLFVAELLRKKLTENGIQVEGGFETGITPNRVIELASASIKLTDMINIINKNSNNFYAECLFKIIGAASSGVEGSAFSASQAIHRFLKENDIYSVGTNVVDGSGISRFNKMSVASIVSLLEKFYLDMKYYDVYYNSLSIAGVDGTLGSRMNHGSAEFNFRGKTGTLNGASSVSGYLKTVSGDDLIISMIFEFNRRGSDYFRGIQDKIIEAVTGYDPVTTSGNSIGWE
ncbi:MAG TPA: D-alanyl-D-alanine carboxypeptidase/D-alanyl-D-alanine-endopeptidase [Ignavibacteriaceae bacterium]|nr:D-alanyl-D-alanine carboxypeptidase/D-alanyl-D-alanine-endopeptidase [Ignavibacteriaceae bacterium]